MVKAHTEEQRWLETLIASYTPGRSLTREFYVSPQVYEHDIQQVFLKHWLFVGHVARIPKAGDYFLFEVAGESVIIIRGKDGAVHGLLNVCAHRGSRVCLEPEGHAKKLVCPYHAWCYEIDGALQSARHMPVDFEKNAHGLKRLHVRVDEGLIHLSFATNPPDFESVAADLRHFFGPHRLAEAKVAERDSVVLKANWKVTAENFLECYHCLHTHPELNHVMAYVAANDSPAQAQKANEHAARWHAQAEAEGRAKGTVNRSDGVFQSATRGPIREGFLSQSKDGLAVAPLMGDFQRYDGGFTAIQFFPNNWFVANNDYAMLARFTPRALRETEVEITWLVHPAAKAGTDYRVEEVTWLWRETLRQDQEITENNQAGIESRFYQPGPLSKDERLDTFYRWYLAQLASP